ncbi:unnamed protein product [Symbiodinium natans]|uniref:Uncharacterized protein n=1 Tax=Symbiodinium natans TaxID=878477 RepID=A0A812IAF7_9DINO|nr:unnamed protein product [Symbiodinium natans]
MPGRGIERACGDFLVPSPTDQADRFSGPTRKFSDLPRQSEEKVHVPATSFHQYGKWYPPEMKDSTRNFGYDVLKREQVPLCEDLRPGVLYEGEKCFSKCGLPGEEDCMPRVMTLPEDGEFEMVKHPVCQSHVECVGKPSRVLCEVVKKGSWQEGLMTRMRSIGGAELALSVFAPRCLHPASGQRDQGAEHVGHAFL